MYIFYSIVKDYFHQCDIIGSVTLIHVQPKPPVKRNDCIALFGMTYCRTVAALEGRICRFSSQSEASGLQAEVSIVPPESGC